MMSTETVREKLDAAEGLNGKVVPYPSNIWERVWECCQGSAEVVEKELDKEESEWWRRREQYKCQ